VVQSSTTLTRNGSRINCDVSCPTGTEVYSVVGDITAATGTVSFTTMEKCRYIGTSRPTDGTARSSAVCESATGLPVINLNCQAVCGPTIP
jgi:hypothetical protein